MLNIDAFFGSVSPIIVPKGIRPVFNPSIKIAKPTITAIKPKQMLEAEAIGCLRINNWKRNKYAARGTTAFICSNSYSTEGIISSLL